MSCSLLSTRIRWTSAGGFGFGCMGFLWRSLGRSSSEDALVLFCSHFCFTWKLLFTQTAQLCHQIWGEVKFGPSVSDSDFVSPSRDGTFPQTYRYRDTQMLISNAMVLEEVEAAKANGFPPKPLERVMKGSFSVELVYIMYAYYL